MALSLRNRFLLPTVILLITGMGLITGASYVQTKTVLEDALIAQVTVQTDSTVQFLNSWIQDLKLAMTSWTNQKLFQSAVQDTFIGRASRKPAADLLAGLKNDYAAFNAIHVVNMAGDVVASSNPEVSGRLNVKDTECHKSASTGKFHCSKATKSPIDQRPVFVLAVPVRDDDENVVGVLMGIIDLSYIHKTFILPIQLGEKGYAFVLDHDGMVVAHPDTSKVLEENIGKYDFGKDILRLKTGMVRYTYLGVHKMAIIREMDLTGWIFAISVGIDEFFEPVRSIRNISLLIAGGVILAGIFLIVWTAGAIVNPIRRISRGMSEGADQVVSAADQVSTASQGLAEGSSLQAAAMEETSSSLEQMSAMTRKNADNSGMARTSMEEVSQVVGQANRFMTDLTRSMESVAAAGQKTSNIIKTIDEIAFQTNLLALNAAVEAARAGEAGAGFAVVAEEVRNLALRSSDAAGTTAELIEETVTQVNDGASLVTRTNEVFAEVSSKVGKTKELVEEIAVASREQSQGIEQVGKAVADMEKVIQENAAGAEESASASEELNAQAEQLKEFVYALNRTIQGGKAVASNSSRPGKSRSRLPKDRSTVKSSAAAPKKKRSPREVSPEDIIPLDEDDFRNF